MMYKRVKLHFDPIDIPYKLMSPIDKSLPLGEMSKEDLATICGLIRDNKLKRVLEVGVAAGGTTAVIANCLSMECADAQMWSIDVSERYYRSPGGHRPVIYIIK